MQCVATGDLIFAAGQTGVDANFEPVSDEIEAQARQTFMNVDHALTAVGAGLEDIVTVSQLWAPNVLVEVQVIAVRPQRDGSLRE